jgi:hypothetical protein
VCISAATRGLKQWSEWLPMLLTDPAGR